MTLPATLGADLARLGPLATFPWHRQQRYALASAADVTMVLGGSQSGKTTVGAGMIARLVRREGPVYRRLRNGDSTPLKIWVAPQTFEKFQTNWEARIIHDVFGGMEFDYVKSPVREFRWADSVSNDNVLIAKTQDQGFRTFESDVVSYVLFDEEPQDPELYVSSLRGLSTTNGCIALTFTPIFGMSWTYGRFYVPTAKPEYQVADRVWRKGNSIALIQMGSADNPASVEGGGVERFATDPSMTEAERRTRLYGDYGFATGLIFPEVAGLRAENESVYLVDKLPADRPYRWVLLADPNQRHGGLLVALDHDGNRYAVAEHYAEGIPDSLHAQAYKEMAPLTGLPIDQIATFADPGGAGKQAILNLAEVGIWAMPVPKGPGSVKASIEGMRRALWVDPSHAHPVTGILGAPRMYFLRGLRSEWQEGGVTYTESRLLWELRQYRQKESKPPDTPIKEKDDVVDCALYSFLVRPLSPDRDEWAATVAEEQSLAARKQLDRLSQKASTEYDELVKAAQRPRRQEWDLR